MDCIKKIFILHSTHRSELLERLKKQLHYFSIPESKLEIIPINYGDVRLGMGNFRYYELQKNIMSTLSSLNGDSYLFLTDHFTFVCSPSTFFHTIKQFHMESKSILFLESQDQFIISTSFIPSFLKQRPQFSPSIVDKTIGQGYYQLHLFLNNPYFNEFQESIMLYMPTEMVDKSLSFRFWNNRGELYLYNTEQMTIKERLGHVLHMLQSNSTINKGKAIDYSAQNIAIIKRHLPHISIQFFPILFHPCFIYKGPILKKEVDVSFVGTMTPRRAALLQQFIKKGITVKIIESFDMNEKLIEVLKSRILINIHAADDYRIFEFTRCAIPIFNSQIIVSEDAEIGEERGINKELIKYVHFTSYHSIINKVQKMLKEVNNYSYTFPQEKFLELTKEDIKHLNIE